MQQKIVSNLVLLILLNLIIKPISIFGIDAAVQNRVGAEEYGLYFSLLNFSFLFNIILDLGINNYTTKHVAQYPKAIVGYLGRVLSIRLVLFLVYTLFTLLIAYSLSYSDRQFEVLFILIFNQFLVSLIAYFRSHLSGLLFFRQDALISILDRFLLILICGWLLFVAPFSNDFKIEWFVWAQTICYGITALIAAVLVAIKIGKPKLKISVPFSIVLLKKTFPYALLIMLMMLSYRVDSVMLERIHRDGKMEAGIYAQAFRILDTLFMFGMLFVTILFPSFAHLIQQKSKDLTPLLNLSSRWLIGGSIAVASYCMFNSEWLLSLIYTNHIEESQLPFTILTLAFIPITFTFIYGTILTANGNLLFLNLVSLFSILLNFSLNLIFISKYGAVGAAFTSLITQAAIGIAQLAYYKRIFQDTIDLKTIARLVGFALATFTMAFLIHDFYPNYENITIAAVILITLVGFKLIRRSDLKLIIGKK